VSTEINRDDNQGHEQEEQDQLTVYQWKLISQSSLICLWLTHGQQLTLLWQEMPSLNGTLPVGM